MNLTTAPGEADAISPALPEAGPRAGGDACALCGAPMEDDQEWCLECGAGRTVIQAPPDWRVPALVVGGIILAALVAFAIALVNLNGQGAGSASQTASRATSTPNAPVRSSVTSWPPGLSGWTVVLAKTTDQSLARDAALGLAAGGVSVGVLDTTQHPLLKPGDWVVFSGRYPDQARAQAAAARLKRAGHAGTVVEVAAPGGI
jgi:hypothetical protein